MRASNLLAAIPDTMPAAQVELRAIFKGIPMIFACLVCISFDLNGRSSHAKTLYR